jgi:hypothetical protein
LLFLNLVDFYFLGIIGHGQIHNEKRKLDDDNESSMAGTSSGSITCSTVSVSFKTAMCQRNKDYLSFRFMSSGEEHHVLSVLFVVRNWQTKLWLQVS